MHKNRLEAFSDGVLAIIITIMVLELKAPHGPSIWNLIPLYPVFLSYILSFIYIAIYWNNHHHLFQVVRHVNGPILWTNIHLLFWLSLIPFVTAWTGENHFAQWPVVLYGFVLLMSALAYYILTKALVAEHGKNSDLELALGKDIKGKTSIVLYAIAMFVALWFPLTAFSIYALVAILWIVPDKRIEKVFKKNQ